MRRGRKSREGGLALHGYGSRKKDASAASRPDILRILNYLRQRLVILDRELSDHQPPYETKTGFRAKVVRDAYESMLIWIEHNIYTDDPDIS